MAKPSTAQRRPPSQNATSQNSETIKVQSPQSPDITAGAAIPSEPMRLTVTSQEVDAAKVHDKLVALTFDAGSSAEPVPQILQVLRQRGLRCTFFLTGQWIERNPEMSRRIAEAGHELGNHSWSHPAFTTLSDAKIREELRRTEEIALEVCGVSTKPLFRPPFGARNEHVRTIVAEEGYLTVYWSIDSWDSVKKDITPEMIIDRVTRRMHPGAIVLMHCGSKATAQALPGLLDVLDAQGYRVVTVSELLRSAVAEQ